jgi:hypothetical protein
MERDVAPSSSTSYRSRREPSWLAKRPNRTRHDFSDHSASHVALGTRHPVFWPE